MVEERHSLQSLNNMNNYSEQNSADQLKELDKDIQDLSNEFKTKSDHTQKVKQSNDQKQIQINNTLTNHNMFFVSEQKQNQSFFDNMNKFYTQQRNSLQINESEEEDKCSYELREFSITPKLSKL